MSLEKLIKPCVRVKSRIESRVDCPHLDKVTSLYPEFCGEKISLYFNKKYKNKIMVKLTNILKEEK